MAANINAGFVKIDPDGNVRAPSTTLFFHYFTSAPPDELVGVMMFGMVCLCLRDLSMYQLLLFTPILSAGDLSRSERLAPRKFSARQQEAHAGLEQPPTPPASGQRIQSGRHGCGP
jgi:hypothetical protein